MIRCTCYYFKKTPRNYHSAIRVADVLVWIEENPAVLSKPFDEVLQGIFTPGIKEKQIGVYSIRMRQEIADADLFCC